jgi:hypothetical protein
MTVSRRGVMNFVHDPTRRRRCDGSLGISDARRELESPAYLPPPDLRELWPSLDIAEQRRVLALAIDAVFVRRGRPRGRSGHGALADFVYISWRARGSRSLPADVRTRSVFCRRCGSTLTAQRVPG